MEQDNALSVSNTRRNSTRDSMTLDNRSRSNGLMVNELQLRQVSPNLGGSRIREARMGTRSAHL